LGFSFFFFYAGRVPNGVRLLLCGEFPRVCRCRCVMVSSVATTLLCCGVRVLSASARLSALAFCSSCCLILPLTLVPVASAFPAPLPGTSSPAAPAAATSCPLLHSAFIILHLFCGNMGEFHKAGTCSTSFGYRALLCWVLFLLDKRHALVCAGCYACNSSMPCYLWHGVCTCLPLLCLLALGRTGVFILWNICLGRWAVFLNMPCVLLHVPSPRHVFWPHA